MWNRKYNKSLPSNMSPFAAGLFRMALEAAKEPAPPVDLPIVRDLKLSDLAERIARDLCHAEALQRELEPPTFADLPAGVRFRHRQLAERAIRTIDPQVRLDIAARATAEAIRELNGAYQSINDVPTYHDIIRLGIATYEALMSDTDRTVR